MAEEKSKNPELADMVTSGKTQESAIKINDFIYMVKDVSNAYLVNTNDGDVLINTGFMGNGDRTKALFAPHRSGSLKRIILTQSHPDHFGGVAELLEDETQVITGPEFETNWADMKRLQPFFAPRSGKLWGSTLRRGGKPAPLPDVTPDITIDREYRFEQGGRHFTCIHTPEGETTDGICVHLPDEEIVFTGNLLGPAFLSVPNLNTIRGDKPRLVRNFLKSLNKIRALEPGLLITGHGEPIEGKAKIRADLTRIYDAVSYLRDATLDGMNAGKSVDELMNEIRLPDALSLGELHGKVSWAVKAIWHEYAGWFYYDSTTSLYGSPRNCVDADILELAGGASALTQRANQHLLAGELMKALHLTDMVLNIDPAHRDALAVRKSACEALLLKSGGQNLSETMWLKSEIAACDAG